MQKVDVYEIKISVKWNFVATQNYVVIQSTALWQMMPLKKLLAQNRDSGIYPCKVFFYLKLASARSKPYEKKTKII
jgi:hypothetical protein